MNSSSHFQGYAQSPRTARTAVTSLLPPESVSEPTSLPLQLSARAQNCLEGLKSSFVVPITSGQIEGDSSARKSAQNPRTVRTVGTSLETPKSGSETTSLPLQLSARAQNCLEALSSNLVSPFGTFDAIYHSIGLEGVSSYARIARGVSIFPEIGSRSTIRVCFARRRVATTLPNITMNL
jgi:hypothetical protein